jgi:hypothetical protein
MGGLGGGGGGGGRGSRTNPASTLIGTAGVGGFGGGDGNGLTGGGGAAFGGAIFVRKGTVNLIDTSFSGNTTVAGTGANNGAAAATDVFICTPDLHSTAAECAGVVNQCGTTVISGSVGLLGSDCPAADSPPIVSAPLDDLTLVKNGGARTIDLSSVFSDLDGDPITLCAVTNSNSALVTTTLTAPNLGLALVSNATGTSTIGVRAVAKSKSATDTFILSVIDSPTVTLAPSSGPSSIITGEAGSSRSVTVRLNAQPTGDVTIGLSSSDLTEGTLSVSSLTFTPATWNRPQVFTVTGVDDFIVDGTVPYQIVTAALSSTDSLFNGVNPSDFAVTNADNDTADIIVSPTIGLNTTEAGGTANFTVKLNSEPSANVIIGLNSSDPSEGSVPASMTFTPANWNTAQSVTVTGVDDAMVDGSINYTILTAAASSTDLNYDGLDAADVSVANADNDIAGVSVTPTSGLVTTESGGTASFSIKLNSQPSANVVIALTSTDTSEGTVQALVTFTPSNWDSAQTVTVTGVDDNVLDGSINYSIQTIASSSDTLYNAIEVPDVAVSNTDNDTSGVTVTPASGLSTTEAGGTANFSLQLNSEPTANVTINLISSDTTEGTVSTSAVTFTPSNWNTAQTITVTGVDDTVVDGTISYSIQTTSNSSDSQYNTINVPDVAVANTDDDGYSISIAKTTDGAEKNTGTSTAAVFTVSVSPTNNSNAAITGTIGWSGTATTGQDYSTGPTTFSIPQGASSSIVTLNVIEDTVVEGDETIIAKITAPSTGTISTDSATLKIADDDKAPNGVLSITGTATEGETLTATLSDADGVGSGTVTYIWTADGVPISGASTQTYTLTAAEVGKVITVKATYTDALGIAEQPNSAPTSAVSAAQVSLNVSGNGINIGSGDSSPSNLDATDFGSHDINTGQEKHSFTIKNNTNQAITVKSISLKETPESAQHRSEQRFSFNWLAIKTLQAAGASSFTLETPTPITIPAQGSSTFDINFNPEFVGLHTADVSISFGNDQTHTFRISGLGTSTSTEPIPALGPLGLLFSILGLWWFGSRYRKP